MDIKEILEELSLNKVIDSSNVMYKPLLGGTTSRLFRIQPNDFDLVIKTNDPQTLRAEADFLKTYQGQGVLPHLHYVDPSYQYIVYSFIPGTTHYIGGNKVGLLQKLVRELINNYKPITDFSGWGLVEEASSSWQEFIMGGVNEASGVLEPYLSNEDSSLVTRLVGDKKSTNAHPFLLHGDCGIHNFIFMEGDLTGVIDPAPVLGEPLYDLLYAFCSTPDDLTTETILPAVKDLMLYNNVNLKTLYSEILIVLYLRIATCIKHHPHDLDEYLRAWDYWKRLLTESDLYE